MLDVREKIRSGLVEWTGMSPAEVGRLLERKGRTHLDEWRFYNPKGAAQTNWYYATSSMYLFANAEHVMPKEAYDTVPAEASVLDFGGGAGTVSISLGFKGCKVFYYDIGFAQRNFVSYMANKHSLDVHVLEWNGRIDLFNPECIVDYFFALDVLEHLHDYPKYVQRIASCVRPKGTGFVYAPFGETEPSHLKDAYNLKQVMASNGLAHVRELGVCEVYQKVK